MSSLHNFWDIIAIDATEMIQNNRLLMPEAKQEDLQFYIDQLKEGNATKTGKDKVFQKTTRKKQIRLEREHTLKTEIVEPVLFLFHTLKFQVMKKNSHISEDLTAKPLLNMNDKLLMP